jgi:hypothetical protein
VALRASDARTDRSEGTLAKGGATNVDEDAANTSEASPWTDVASKATDKRTDCDIGGSEATLAKRGGTNVEEDAAFAAEASP